MKIHALFSFLLAAILIAGCATPAREMMPTPTLYQLPDGHAVFGPAALAEERRSSHLDLLYITDRALPTAAELEALREKQAPKRSAFLDGQARTRSNPPDPLPYGQQRARRIAFGSAQVRIGPGLDWDDLREQSQLAERTRDVNLELGQVQELGAFPDEPYRLHPAGGGKLMRDRAELARHAEIKGRLRHEVQRRLAAAPENEVLLSTCYVPGDETVVMGTTAPERWVGKAQIGDAYQHFVEDFDAGTVERDCPWMQVETSGDVGWITANCEYQDSLEGVVRSFALNVTLVMQKLDGAWKLRTMHFSNPTAP